MGSTPKEYREICNTLVDEQGWTFVEGKTGRKHRLIPPDPTKRICLVPATPSDSYFGFTKWIGQLRRSGAQIDENGNSTVVVEKPQTVGPSIDDAAMTVVDTDIKPVSTLHHWWRITDPEPEPQPTPEPQPEPEPEPRLSRYAIGLLSRLDAGSTVAPPPYVPKLVGNHPDDAEGAAYSLNQARDLLRQGYHVNRVIKKTGWGRNWFHDLVDDTGYLAEAAPVSPVRSAMRVR